MTERRSKTLFVRNLPFSASNQKLSETFEEVGPLKTAFVVVDKESGKCKGYGYVQFSTLEDAVKAKETVTHCEGRKVFISFADAKKKWKDQHKKEATDNGSQEGMQQEESVAEPVQEPKPKTKEPKNQTVKQKPVKRCRIILRNLPFKCKESHIRNHFEKFGAISEVSIPLKDGSRSRGFAFVQYTDLGAAQKAVAEMNAKEIMGRPVAVDWAVAKDRFLASSRHDSDKDCEESEQQEDGKQGNENLDDEASDSEESDAEEEKASDDDSDSEDSDEDEADDDDTDTDSEGSEEEDDEDDEEKDEERENKREKMKMARKSDVEEGRTLFIRNVPFAAEEEELEEAFQEFGDLVYVRLVMDKVTGQPRGTAFVQFVEKESAEQCLSKAQGSEKDGGMVIQGRRLLVVEAMSRTQAQGQREADKAKEQKDNRNLFLAREGLIRAGTQAAMGVSQDDMKKRMKVELVKREKLKNQNIFVSSTRLCLHNLPPRVDEQELRVVLKQTVDHPAMKITECRVMRDLARTNQSGVSKSLGYAFVNFSTHEHALKALQGLNNSPVFGEQRRPIVEFSLENKKALEAKQKRLEKSKAQATKKKQQGKEGGDATKPKTPPNNKRPKKPSADQTQDTIAKAMHRGAPKGMPKRFGPKVRHRKRGQQQEQQQQLGKKQKQKQQRLNRPTQQQQQQQQQPRPKLKKMGKKKKEVTDNVDKLIQKRQGKKNRWFESS